MPRPTTSLRALAAVCLAMAPMALAPGTAVADPPIVPIPNAPDNPNSPDSPTNNGNKDDSNASGADSQVKPAPGVFPDNDSALHMSVQANDPMSPPKHAKPIIPAGE